MIEIPQNYRQLTTAEREILDVLLKKDFPGKSELVEQAKDAEVKAVDENHSLSFLVHSAMLAPIKRGIPTEARMKDTDGVFVNILLHVVDGRLNELEIYKDDGSPIETEIIPSELALFDHYLDYDTCKLSSDKNP